MASRKVPRWNTAQLKAAVKGGPDAYGLRSVMYGFTPANGFDLRKVSDWTPYQRRKVREAYSRLAVLTKQPTVPKRLHGENLKRAQEHFHGDVSSRGFKVVLLPDYGQTIEKLDKRTGEIKRVRTAPRLAFNRDGTIDLDYAAYKRRFYPFNQAALARDTEAEIRKGIKTMPGARQFFAAIGGNQDDPDGEGMLQGVTLAGDSRTFISKIARAMERYDGRTAIPKDSKLYGQNPKHHNWRQWLHGMYGYQIKEGGSVRDVQKAITEARKETQRKRKSQRLPLWTVYRNGRVIGSVRAGSERAALNSATAEYGDGVTVEL